MTIPSLLELLHVFAVFWFLGGLLGRTVAQAQARRATDLRELDTIMRISSVFDRHMVRTGSLLVLAAGILTAEAKGWHVLGPITGGPSYWLFASLLIFLTAFTLVPLVFIPRGRLFRAALEDARVQGGITPRLTAALGDRTVALAHAWEWIAVALVTTLMVTKPF